MHKWITLVHVSSVSCGRWSTASVERGKGTHERRKIKAMQSCNKLKGPNEESYENDRVECLYVEQFSANKYEEQRNEKLCWKKKWAEEENWREWAKNGSKRMERRVSVCLLCAWFQPLFSAVAVDVVFRLKFISLCTFCELHSPYFITLIISHHLRYSSLLVLSSLRFVAAAVVFVCVFFFCSFHFLCIFGGSEELSYGFFPTSSPVFFVLNSLLHVHLHNTFSDAIICCRASSFSLGFWFWVAFRFMYVCVFVRLAPSFSLFRFSLALSMWASVCLCGSMRDIMYLRLPCNRKSVPFNRSCQWKISGWKRDKTCAWQPIIIIIIIVIMIRCVVCIKKRQRDGRDTTTNSIIFSGDFGSTRPKRREKKELSSLLSIPFFFASTSIHFFRRGVNLTAAYHDQIRLIRILMLPLCVCCCYLNGRFNNRNTTNNIIVWRLLLLCTFLQLPPPLSTTRHRRYHFRIARIGDRYSILRRFLTTVWWQAHLLHYLITAFSLTWLCRSLRFVYFFLSFLVAFSPPLVSTFQSVQRPEDPQLNVIHFKDGMIWFNWKLCTLAHTHTRYQPKSATLFSSECDGY